MRTLLNRFESRVERIPECGCWIWCGHLNRYGYGGLKVQGRSVKAHRVAYELFAGNIPAGLDVLHRCDVRCCVNPSHLFLGTQADNVRDMHQKGRANYENISGERHYRAKLTYEIVSKIKDDPRTLREIAHEFGVSIATVGKAKTGQTWKRNQFEKR